MAERNIVVYEETEKGWKGESVTIHENKTMFNVEIFKECEDCKLRPTEMDLIMQWSDNSFRFYEDYANGYVAFALANCDREDADNLVGRLNRRCERKGEEPNWYLGEEGEEYVFVD